MIDTTAQVAHDVLPGTAGVDPVHDAPPPEAAPRRRRRWILLAVAGFTVLVVVAFAVFAFGVVGASAAGGCGGP